MIGQVAAGSGGYLAGAAAGGVLAGELGLLDVHLCFALGSRPCPDNSPQVRRNVAGVAMISVSALFASNAAVYLVEDTAGRDAGPFWWPLIAGTLANAAATSVVFAVYDDEIEAVEPAVFAGFFAALAAEIIVMRLLRPD